jgi:hypothetical protein
LNAVTINTNLSVSAPDKQEHRLVNMPPLGETKLPAAQRSRKSIGAHTNIRKSADKENVAADLGASLAAGRAKSRSKSLGPGGLDALRQSTGNRRAVCRKPRSIFGTYGPNMLAVSGNLSKAPAIDPEANHLCATGNSTAEEEQLNSRELEDACKPEVLRILS